MEAEDVDDRLAELIRTRRRLLGLTQAELANRVGISQAYISNLERGRTQLPKVHIRRELAQALRMSHIDLLIAAGELDRHELPGSADAMRPVVVGMAAQLDVLPTDVRRALERVIEDLHRLHLMTCEAPGPAPAGTTPVPVALESTPAG